MDIQDLSQNFTVTRLTKLMRDLQRSQSPQETMRVARRAFAETHGFTASMLLTTHGLPAGHYRIVNMELEDLSLQISSAGGRWEESGPVCACGVLSAIVTDIKPQLIQNVDWSHDPLLRDALRGYASIIAIPIAGDRLIVDWAILLRKEPASFDRVDLEAVVERAVLLGALMENQALAAKLARANQQLDGDARRLGELQRALLPDALPRIAGLEIAASYNPSARAGGDLYDFFPLAEPHVDRACWGNPSRLDDRSRWCVFIGDAAGHDLATAVVMAIVQAVLRVHPAGSCGPAALLKHANRQLCSKRLSGFVTGFLGIYEPRCRRLTYSSAGHPPPLLRHHADRSISALDEARSYPIGIDGTQTFKEAAVQLEAGDTLLLYTDGITEARSQADAFFGEDRLALALHEAADKPPDLVERIRSDVLHFENGQARRDDQTLVAAGVL